MACSPDDRPGDIARPWAALHDQVQQRPPVTGTLPHLLDRAADRFPDRIALTAPEGTTCTFRQLAADAARFGSALQTRDVHKGERVAVMLPNTAA